MLYSELKTLFETAKNKNSGKPYGNNTRIYKCLDNLAIRLHDTDIITVFPGGNIVLNSGGWKTVTTKRRMNSVLNKFGIKIYSNKGQWFVSYRDNVVIEFKDGIIL